MTPDAARAEVELFDEAMSCRDALPAAFVSAALDERRIVQSCERAEALLRTIAQIEDGTGEDDDRAHDPVIQRLEAKVNVLLELVGGLIARDLAMPPVREVRWSRKGIVLAQAEGGSLGEHGLLRLQPAAWLPQLLELPARVIAVEPGAERRLWLRVEPLPDPLEAALERHLFRVHRRAIARRNQQKARGG